MLLRHLAVFCLADSRNTLRDPMLQVTLVTPFLLFAVLRFGLPLAEEAFELNLLPHHSLIMALAMLLMPLMTGMVISFILLDELDDQVLLAVAVTPISKSGYLQAKIILPVIYSFCISLLLLQFSGLVSVPLAAAVPAVIISSLLAPVIALFISAFSQNKVIGLTLSKASGMLLLFPLAAYLLDDPWSWLMAPAPTFWLTRMFLALEESLPAALGYASAAAAFQLLLIKVLAARFEKKTAG